MNFIKHSRFRVVIDTNYYGLLWLNDYFTSPLIKIVLV
jgi:hypothetical protein